MRLQFKFTGVNLVLMARRKNMLRRIDGLVQGLPNIRKDRVRLRKKRIRSLQHQADKLLKRL